MSTHTRPEPYTIQYRILETNKKIRAYYAHPVICKIDSTKNSSSERFFLRHLNRTTRQAGTTSKHIQNDINTTQMLDDLIFCKPKTQQIMENASPAGGNDGEHNDSGRLFGQASRTFILNTRRNGAYFIYSGKWHLKRPPPTHKTWSSACGRTVTCPSH